MNIYKKNKEGGFTILELLVVIAIIGIIAAVVLVALDESREKGRDAGRASQTQEILKALELYYSDNGSYPTVSGTYNTGDYLDQIDSFGGYLKRMPDEAGSRYYYCVSAGGSSVLLAVNTERDDGGSDWCNITRSNPPYGCDVWQTANASDSCMSRF